MDVLTLPRPNLTSAFAPPQANVTFHAFHNVYVYSALKLWIAYGLAILFTATASVIGLFAMDANGASYSHNFSSIFRAARGAKISVELKDEDTLGNDPLPSYLSAANVWLASHRSQGNNGGRPFWSFKSAKSESESAGDGSSLLHRDAPD